MPKININFKGKNYSIDKSLLAGAISELEAHFGNIGTSTPSPAGKLEGDGGEYYTLAPTALTFRSTEPLNEFQEVRVNGHVVDPSNYTLEEGSTIVNLSIDYLKTLPVGTYDIEVVFANNAPSGGFTVAAPELNEHGFYYNQPYTAYVDAFGGRTVFFMREDGTMDVMLIDAGVTETCTYIVEGNNLTINASSGTFTGKVGEDCISCYELGKSFILNNPEAPIVSDKDYIYIYKDGYGGYEVYAIDKNKAEYAPIKTGINGYPTIWLAMSMFFEQATNTPNTNMVVAPEIPNTVEVIGQAAFFECQALTSVNIPDRVTIIQNDAFCKCAALTNVTFGSGLRLISDGAFYECNLLTNITFRGTVEQWNSVKKLNNCFIGVPATHVQCTDGQVAL